MAISQIDSTGLANASVTTIKLVAGAANAAVLDAANATGTGAMYLPSGTTAQRAGITTSGALRWNTSNTAVEVYDGTGWQTVTATKQYIYSVSYLIVAGGGGGGYYGGGGGAAITDVWRCSSASPLVAVP